MNLNSKLLKVFKNDKNLNHVKKTYAKFQENTNKYYIIQNPLINYRKIF